jgi:hypothetical protein
MLILIVSHCWRYSRCLAYQLSSLVLHPPKNAVEICVVHANDEATEAMITWFAVDRPTVTVSDDSWPVPYVLQRAHGRHQQTLGALSQMVDVFWWADADHFFGPGCLDAIPELEPDVLYYPRTVLRHKTHALGDEAIRRVVCPGVYEIRPADFEPVRGRPIGGLQIVSGETARARGYCRNSKWQKPLPDGATKFSFGSDVAYRRQFKRQVALDLPNLYRIRQTTSGEVDRL